MLSKADLVHDDALVKQVEEALEARGLEVRRISAAATQGLDELLRATFDAVDAAREEVDDEDDEPDPWATETTR